MTSTIDPHAFAIAIELTKQISTDGAFVDEDSDSVDDDDNVHNLGNELEGDTFNSEGVQVSCEALSDNVDPPTGTEHTIDAATVHGLNRTLSWWSLIERMVDVSPEDLLALKW
ncbi:Hypothetical protein PHPALM_2239 [Phytophthora palmivora]|uniref:Uncharacterized protein n=1 Tax=Phytophthora palmivora TaxID=4796 RepID=A0A2P4YQA6_9STRA|nr:Hypothetical protein PHPALM_2239 [Phytophthora palmivora]